MEKSKKIILGCLMIVLGIAITVTTLVLTLPRAHGWWSSADVTAVISPAECGSFTLTTVGVPGDDGTIFNNGEKKSVTTNYNSSSNTYQNWVCVPTINEGYAFDHWTVGSTNYYTETLQIPGSGDKTIALYLVESSRQVTFQSNNTDYGTVNYSTLTVSHNATVITSGNTLTIEGTTITATPTASTAQYIYAFSNWSVPSGTITENTTITANFSRTLRSYTVSISVNPIGYGTVSTESFTVDYGTTIYANSNTLRQTTNSGTVKSTATAASPNAQYSYSFSNWTSGNTTLSTSTGVTITGATAITANFIRTLNSYTITTIAVSSVGGSISNGGSLTYGAHSLLATANAGYEFSYWLLNGNEFSGNTANPLNIMVTGTATYSAVFSKKSLEPNNSVIIYIECDTDTNLECVGTATITGYTNLNANNMSIHLYATPSRGYRFVCWKSNNTVLSLDSAVDILLNDITNKTVVACFEKITS